MDDNYIVNGEIFIRRGPRKFNYGGDFLEHIENFPYQPGINDDKLEHLEKLNNMFSNVDGDDDYSFTEQFYVLHTNNGKDIKLVSVPAHEVESNDIVSYNSKEEIDKDFFSLREMLSNGKYHEGRLFYRTKPTSIGDRSYMRDAGIHVICEYNGILLVIRNGEYKIIESIYTSDNNYIIKGEPFDKYSKPQLTNKQIYKDIVKQLSNKLKEKREWDMTHRRRL